MEAYLKYGVAKPKYYRVKKRKAFECNDCGSQLYLLFGTIFEKTTTAFMLWFHDIYLFSVLKNGVSVKEIERQVVVSYDQVLARAEKLIDIFSPFKENDEQN